MNVKTPHVSRAWILAALMTTIMLAAMDATIVSTVIPQIVADIGGFSQFTWVFSIYMLAQTVCIPVYGKLADQYGRKPVLLLGILVFLVGSASCAMAWNMSSLIAFRALQGIGAGAVMATVNTLAGDLFALHERAKIQGWLSSVWGLSAILGPTLGGFFADYVSWRWIFFINVPVGIIALFLISVFLHEQVEKNQHTIDYLGGLLILVSIASFVFMLLQGGIAWAWLSWQSALLGGLFALSFVLAIQVEKRAKEPIMPAWLWQRRILTGSNLAMVMMGIMMMGPIAYLPTFVQSFYGISTMMAGLVLAVMSIGWPLASSFSGRLYLRIDFRQTALIGVLLLLFASMSFLLFAQHLPVAFVALNQFLLGAGFGLISTPLLVGCQSIVPWSERGVVTGANMFSRYLGQTLGAAIFGMIFNTLLHQRLLEMPHLFDVQIPMSEVITSLQHDYLPAAVADYLRMAVFDAMWAIYCAIFIFAVLAGVFILLTPKRFPLLQTK